jgi:hypothetical protein
MTYDDVLEDMFQVAIAYGVRPDIPLEAEAFTRSLVDSFTGPAEDFRSWYSAKLSEHYKTLGERPAWVQDPEWPFDLGVPMTFVGQIPAHFRSGSELTFFVFWNPSNAATKVVIQWD